MEKISSAEFLERLQRALLKVLPVAEVQKIRFKVYANSIYFDFGGKTYKYAWYQHLYVSENGSSFKQTSFNNFFYENKK